IGALASSEGANRGGFAEVFRAVQRLDANGFERSEPGFDEKLDITLIAEAREDAAVTAGIFSRDEQAAGLDESALELHFFFEEIDLGWRTRSDRRAHHEIIRARREREGLQNALLQRRTIGLEGLEDGKRGC